MSNETPIKNLRNKTPMQAVVDLLSSHAHDLSVMYYDLASLAPDATTKVFLRDCAMEASDFSQALHGMRTKKLTRAGKRR